MKLLLYDTEMQSANGYLPRAITEAARQELGKENVRLCGHADVVAQAASGRWDGLLAIGGAGADRHLLEALRETQLPRLLWTTEDPYERRLVERVEPVFDHVFSNEARCAGASARTTYLPLAAEPAVHQRPVRRHDADYAYDLTFVGTAWPNRVASLQRLLASPDLAELVVEQALWVDDTPALGEACRLLSGLCLSTQVGLTCAQGCMPNVGLSKRTPIPVLRWRNRVPGARRRA
jgi:hypothetical protein